jgi:cell shape-determining protein MreC
LPIREIIKRLFSSSDEEKILIPSAADFSQFSIARALRKHALNHPTVIFPMVATFGAIFAALVLGFTEFIFFAIILTFGFSVTAWVFNQFILAGNFELQHVKKLKQALEKATENKRIQLEKELIKQNFPDGAQQLKRFKEKYDSLNELLQAKLDTGEMTYSRYNGIAQEVLHSGYDNLRNICQSLMSVSEINAPVIKKKLNSLSQLINQDADAKEQYETLKERLEVRQRQLDKIKHLTLENEKAMTLIDTTAAAIADMDAGQDEAKVDMENSMKMLAEMAERAYEYSS